MLSVKKFIEFEEGVGDLLPILNLIFDAVKDEPENRSK
jgi:hypothetical protein